VLLKSEDSPYADQLGEVAHWARELGEGEPAAALREMKSSPSNGGYAVRNGSLDEAVPERRRPTLILSCDSCPPRSDLLSGRNGRAFPSI
jgi:hypothetical protein